ncbi:hypothetical protein CesoFtcFv8_019440 [Champsocephalus esox]|uniref:Uncharacterized protein n=1 Tax=Champsocephalus esox TaxID=159716 RepID=A0AAN8GM79_9TELE|nr:hypothetical protein CesoFtcFv8_019440 [Champsocephalus esox]
MLVVQSCCMRTEGGRMDPAEDPYYREEEQPSPNPLPVYSPQTPVTQTPGPTPVIVGDPPKKNRTGFYSINP